MVEDSFGRVKPRPGRQKMVEDDVGKLRVWLLK